MGTATKSLKMSIFDSFCYKSTILYLVLNLKLCKTFLQLSISLSSAEDSAVSSDSICNQQSVNIYHHHECHKTLYRTRCSIFNEPHVIFISKLKNNFDMFSDVRPKHDISKIRGSLQLAKSGFNDFNFVYLGLEL